MFNLSSLTTRPDINVCWFPVSSKMFTTQSLSPVMFIIHPLAVCNKIVLPFLTKKVAVSSVLFGHGHKKLKDSLEARAVLLIFSLELEESGVAVQKIHESSKKWWLYEELLSENDFEAVLATLCCYDYGANASEAVQKIATDQKDYQKCVL